MLEPLHALPAAATIVVLGTLLLAVFFQTFRILLLCGLVMSSLLILYSCSTRPGSTAGSNRPCCCRDHARPGDRLRARFYQ